MLWDQVLNHRELNKNTCKMFELTLMKAAVEVRGQSHRSLNTFVRFPLTLATTEGQEDTENAAAVANNI